MGGRLEKATYPLTSTIFDPAVYVHFEEEQAVSSTDLLSAKHAAQRLHDCRCWRADYFLRSRHHKRDTLARGGKLCFRRGIRPRIEGKLILNIIKAHPYLFHTDTGAFLSSTYVIPYASFESTVTAGGERYIVEFKVTESPSGEKAVHSVEIVKSPEAQIRALYDQHALAQKMGVPFDTIQKLENGSGQGYTGKQAGDGNAFQRILNEVEQARKLGMTAREYAMSKGVPSSLTDAEAASLDLYNLKGFKDDADQTAGTDELIDKAVENWNSTDTKGNNTNEGAGDAGIGKTGQGIQLEKIKPEVLKTDMC